MSEGQAIKIRFLTIKNWVGVEEDNIYQCIERRRRKIWCSAGDMMRPEICER